VNNPDTDLLQRVTALDTDAAEALLDPAPEARPGFTCDIPPGFEHPLIEFYAAIEQPRRQPIIQDGQRLADELQELSQWLIDGDWTRLKLHREAKATVLAESAEALKEFGA
jgi:hypothetical protein